MYTTAVISWLFSSAISGASLPAALEVVDSLLQSTASIRTRRHHADMASCCPVLSTKSHGASSTQNSSGSGWAKFHDFALVEKIRDALKGDWLFVATLHTFEGDLVLEFWHRLEEVSTLFKIL